MATDERMATDDVEAFNQELRRENFMGQWELVAGEDEDDGPAPYCWKWDDIESAIERSRDVIDLDEQPQGARRSIGLINPAGGPTTSTFSIGVQSVSPGEVAAAHRHSLTAFRFVIEGSEDVYTNVHGEEFPMEPGDLILTPRMTWHDHGNESEEEAFWLDGVDGPFVRAIGADFFENYPDRRQPDSRERGYHRTRFPAYLRGQRTSGDSAVEIDRFEGDGSRALSAPFRFPWSEAVEQLRLADERDLHQDPVDGTVLEYRNPVTGEAPTLESIALSLVRLPGESDGRHRHNSAEAYYVVRGSGTTTVGDEALDWAERDCFVVPGGQWHAHESHADESILFSISDRPIFESFNVHRRETE